MRKEPSRILWVLVVLMCAHDLEAQSESVDKSPHRTGFVTVNKVKLHYLDWGGKGETILFLHGLGDTAHIYDELAPKFTNQFHALAVTRRGHGQSEIPENGYDTATRVEDLRQFLNALNIRRAVLVGHSAAGGEMTLLAGAHPDLVTKLVYLDAVYNANARVELSREMPPEMVPTKADTDSLENLRRWVRRRNDGWSDAWEATLRVHFTSDGKTFRDREKRSRALGLMMEPGVEAETDYKKIKAPVLCLNVVGFPTNMVRYIRTLPEPRRKVMGAFLNRVRDTKEREIARFRKELPNARVITFTNVDHHCFIEKESEVVRDIREFLTPTTDDQWLRP
jgi:pimeloyl-ACP methyl ester carboxylesterase